MLRHSQPDWALVHIYIVTGTHYNNRPERGTTTENKMSEKINRDDPATVAFIAMDIVNRADSIPTRDELLRYIKGSTQAQECWVAVRQWLVRYYDGDLSIFAFVPSARWNNKRIGDLRRAAEFAEWCDDKEMEWQADNRFRNSEAYNRNF